jgi:hypothetical protein
LGIVKYFWGQTTFLLEKAKKLDVFQSRLNSVVQDGLNIPKIPADYMCQYKGGLIGKHFKTISQIMAFTVYDLVPLEVLSAWTIIGRLTVLLWHTEIDDVSAYLVGFLCAHSLSLGLSTHPDGASNLHWRYAQRYRTLQPQHSSDKAKIPFSRPPSCLYRAFRTSDSVFH